MKKKKKRLLILLLIVFLFVSVAYSLLYTTLTINGTATINGSWNIHIPSIEDNGIVLRSKSNGVIETTGYPTVEENNLNAAFNVSLNKPGDFIEYDILIVNAGNIDAVLDSINFSNYDNTYITYKYGTYINDVFVENDTSNINNLDSLGSENSSGSFVVRVEYNDIDSLDLEGSKNVSASLSLNYKQVTN